MWAVVITTYMCLDSHLKNTIGSEGSGDGQFDGPCSMIHHRIQKLTTGGKFLHKFGKE